MKIPSQISPLLMEANRREEYTSYIKYPNLFLLPLLLKVKTVHIKIYLQLNTPIYIILLQNTQNTQSQDLYINTYTNINQPRINIQCFTITIYF